MPLSSQQKGALAQFISFTQADKKVAERILKNSSWNLQQAVNVYFQDQSGAARPAASGGGVGSTSALNKMFDKYRDDPANSPDSISISGTMKYLEDLNVPLESISVLIIFELLQSPTMGELTRTGFVQGWSAHSASSLAAQKTTIANLVSTLPQPPSRATAQSLYRRVYKYTFKIALPQGQRAVPLDMAIEYWGLLFGPQGFDWRNRDPDIDWLPAWTTFLQEKWKKSVNKDLWEQTLLFAMKTTEDPSMGWWSEESAWPGVIDEFVEHMKEMTGKQGSNRNTDAMELS